MVEGGERTPVRKPYDTKPTCLAQFHLFRRHVRNEQETQPASPMVSPELTDRKAQASSLCDASDGPMSKAREACA